MDMITSASKYDFSKTARGNIAGSFIIYHQTYKI
jgi:hypothetical protein